MNIQKFIKVAVIEQKSELRQRLVSLINQMPGLFCTGNYAAVKDALLEFSKNLPDIVLCNFMQADVSEKKVINILRKKYNKLPILVLNLYEEENHPLEITNRHANGCLLKLTLPAELLRNTRFTDESNWLVQNTTAVNLFHSFRNFSLTESKACNLTPHEIRLLKLLIDGHNHTTSAKILNVSYNTVKFHMRRIYQKLEVNSKSAAVAKAMRYRLTE